MVNMSVIMSTIIKKDRKNFVQLRHVLHLSLSIFDTLLKHTKTQRLAYSNLFKETTHMFDYIKAHPAYSDKEVI